MAAKEMTEDKEAIIQAYIDINSKVAEKSLAAEIKAKE